MRRRSLDSLTPVRPATSKPFVGRMGPPALVLTNHRVMFTMGDMENASRNTKVIATRVSLEVARRLSAQADKRKDRFAPSVAGIVAWGAELALAKLEAGEKRASK